MDVGEAAGESGVGDGVNPVEPDAPGGRAQEPHHLDDQRGLARAVVAEESDHLASTHPHGDTGVGPHRVRPASEVLVKVLNGEYVGHEAPFLSFNYLDPSTRSTTRPIRTGWYQPYH